MMLWTGVNISGFHFENMYLLREAVFSYLTFLAVLLSLNAFRLFLFLEFMVILNDMMNNKAALKQKQ